MTRTTGAGMRRRSFLLRGIGIGIGASFPAYLDDAPVRTGKRGQAGGNGNAAVPATRISLADYGGRPGAAPGVVIKAFERAFAALAAAGGGTLLVPAGEYDLGNHAEATTIILCRNLRDIAISAYGAVFVVTTTASVMPQFFYFFNFQNITIAGASFVDRGFNPWYDWKGMYCAGIQADRPSRGFRMIDCYAERVVGLLASHNNAAGRHYMRDISVQGEVRYAYYGVGASYIRQNIDVELVCHNVRRAFIAYSLKNADIVVRSHSTSNWPGSNGLVALVSNGASTGNVEDVRVRVDASGACIHESYVHFYHQGPEKEGYMRDIDATVNVFTTDSARKLFVFDHEIDGVQATTARTWDRISLHGTIGGRFTGKVISNASLTSAPGAICVDRNLAELEDMRALAALFRVASRDASARRGACPAGAAVAGSAKKGQ